jgi:hypothetical protein
VFAFETGILVPASIMASIDATDIIPYNSDWITGVCGVDVDRCTASSSKSGTSPRECHLLASLDVEIFDKPAPAINVAL